MSDALTFRTIDTPELQEAALDDLLTAMGYRIELVDGFEFLIPTDPQHPDYGKCVRSIERARKRLARAKSYNDSGSDA